MISSTRSGVDKTATENGWRLSVRSDQEDLYMRMINKDGRLEREMMRIAYNRAGDVSSAAHVSPGAAVDAAPFLGGKHRWVLRRLALVAR